MKRLQIAQYIAIVATAFSTIGLGLGFLFKSSAFPMIVMMIGFVIGLAAYVFGGLGKAISMALEIAKWGWIVAPFPVDLFTGPASFICALFLLVFFPIIPVRKAYNETMRY